ncbi:MAG: MarR family transcriptional regulator [Clostridiales bacterium]|nr:MarR family transcriptional regulator [Clostridiales bacterium]
MVDRFERFSLIMAEISRCWHKLAVEEMERLGLKGGHVTYFLALARNEEGLTASQLCEDYGKDKSDVSRMMAILEQKGLVKKEGGHQKGYRGVFVLTEEGWKIADYVRYKSGIAARVAGKELTDEQRAALYFAMEGIAASMRNMCQNGGIPEE